jgi:hypothetical protein
MGNAYREATAISLQWEFADGGNVLLKQAQSFIDYMMDEGMLPGLTDLQRAEYAQHLCIPLLGVIVMHERTQQYGVGSWRQIGWAGHLLRTWDKTVRLMNGHWWRKAEPDEKALDNIVDLINHATFTIRAMNEGNERGVL